MKLRVRYRYLTAGGHVHVSVFANIVPDLEGDYTLGHAGEFTLRVDEFPLWRDQQKSNEHVRFDFVDMKH